MTPESSCDLREWAIAAADDLRPLPPSVYACDEFLRLEIDGLFHREWICAGHESELETVGDYVTFDIVDRPLLLVRDEGRIRAYANVCRHRGATIAGGSGRRKLFTCPYHAWTYGLDGCLKRAPHIDESKVSDVCLAEYRVETWQGLVFVNLDADAEPLTPRLTDLRTRIAPYDLSRYRVVHREQQQVDCNWKVLVENFCESYHLFSVHSQTLEPETPTRTAEVHPGGPGFNHHTVTNVERDFIEHVACIYPCTTLVVGPESLIWLSVLPTRSQSLQYTAWIALTPDEQGEISKSGIAARVEALRTFMGEDKATIERVQRGLASLPELCGALHPAERTNWEFGHYLARMLA